MFLLAYCLSPQNPVPSFLSLVGFFVVSSLYSPDSLRFFNKHSLFEFFFETFCVLIFCLGHCRNGPGGVLTSSEIAFSGSRQTDEISWKPHSTFPPTEPAMAPDSEWVCFFSVIALYLAHEGLDSRAPGNTPAILEASRWTPRYVTGLTPRGV